MWGLSKKSNSTGSQVPVVSAGDLGDWRQKSEIIINSIDDGVILIDSQGVIQLCNPAAAALTGWKVEEATGVNAQTVLIFADSKGEPKTGQDSPIAQAFQSTQPIRDGEAALLSRQNVNVPISLSITPLRDSNQNVTAIVAVFRNVAEERSSAQQRADFISTASHEMRTPVAAIEGYLSLALNEKVATIDQRARGYLEKAHSSTQHLGQLFQDLLTSAKAEDGRLISHPTAVEMSSYLDNLTSDLHFSAEKKGLDMSFEIGNTPATIDATTAGVAAGDHMVKPLYYVLVDPDRLREVITNLFDNAVKYTPEGKVVLGLTGDKNYVQVSVSDTGPGIPAQDIPHLFQKFYRVDNSNTRTIGGTGLGLFICRKIIELYNGKIWVESQIGKGSTFFINLPRVSSQKASELMAAAKPGQN